MMSPFSRLYIVLSLFIVTAMAGHMVLAQPRKRIIPVADQTSFPIVASRSATTLPPRSPTTPWQQAQARMMSDLY